VIKISSTASCGRTVKPFSDLNCGIPNLLMLCVWHNWEISERDEKIIIKIKIIPNEVPTLIYVTENMEIMRRYSSRGNISS
jgi:hypothetical protein